MRASLSMALIALCMVGAGLGATSHGSAATDATPRERIIGYTLFYYVGDPNNDHPRYRPQLLSAEDLLAEKEEADFWRDDDIPGLQDLVRALVMEPTDAETGRFQSLVADLLDVRGGRVAVYLIDDAGQELADDGEVVEKRYAASVDGTGKAVWPSAKDDKALSLEREVLAGSFSTGEVHLRSAVSARSVFLHELTHVQALSDRQPHLYFVGGLSFTYGADGKHYSNELLPNLSMVYDEAAANAMEMLYHPDEVREAFDWLARGVAVVERTRPDPAMAAGRSVMPDVWLFDRIKATGAEELPLTSESASSYARFELTDMPGRFLLHNETAMGIVLAESARRTVGYRGLLRAFHRTNRVVEATLAGPAEVSRLSEPELAHVLIALGREILGGDDPTMALSSGGPMDHLLPIAYLDYMIGRDAATEDDFAALFGNRIDRNWLDVYWEAGRPRLDEILPAVSQAPRSYDDLALIEAAFTAGTEGG